MPDCIYALVDPRNNEIRYVGKTNQKLGYRLTQHVHRATHTKSNQHMLNWLRELLTKDMIPAVSVLEVLSSGMDWQARERFWIAYGIAEGWPLTNMTEGGEGIVNPSAELRQARSRRMMGNPGGTGYRNNAKLAAEDVGAIRAEYAKGNISYKGLARRYGVHYSTIGYVVQHKTWQHIM